MVKLTKWKTVVFTGGIGNQLFQYQLYFKLREMGYCVRALDVCRSYDAASELGINKFFKREIVSHSRLSWFLFKKYYKLCYHCGMHGKVSDTDFDTNEIIFDGYWQDKKYFADNLKIEFKDLKFTERNADILKTITESDSVAIHIRRGDYLQYPQIYDNICTQKYYSDAMNLVTSRISKPRYFIFSDDIEWCKEHFKLRDAKYVDWNSEGDHYIFDMILMSHCKGNIIANSTFSFWAAYLNRRAEVVVYPSKWFNDGRPAPDCFPESWFGLAAD